MKYVIEVLQDRLRDEVTARQSANRFLGKVKTPSSNPTINAFEESRRLANERIPQIEKAIGLLTR